MRRRFGKLINELARKDKKIVLLVGDIGYGIFDDFRKNNPKQLSKAIIFLYKNMNLRKKYGLNGFKSTKENGRK